MAALGGRVHALSCDVRLPGQVSAAFDRVEEALLTFTALRTRKPEYVAMYLMCGQMLEGANRRDEAREWLETGIATATARGESHALGELQSALAGLSD